MLAFRVGRGRLCKQFRRPELQGGALFIDIAVAIVDAFDAADPMPQHAFNDNFINAQTRHVRSRSAAQVVDCPMLDLASQLSLCSVTDPL